MIRCPGSAPVVLAVYGEPVVGRALVLLLRGSGYDARFVPASSSSEPGALEGVRLLLLTPQLSSGYRENLLASLGAAEIPILELVRSSGGTREGGARDNRSGRVVPWPCSTEELKRRIEAALSADPRADVA